MKIFSNIHLKLLALISAIVLWFVVITVENTIYVFPQELEIDVRNLGSNLSLANELPEVKLFLQVSKEELKSLTPDDFNVYIDLGNAQAGEKSAQIQASTTVPQVKILKIEPVQVDLKLSPVTEKEVEVEINVIGNPQEGYIVSNVEAGNQTVKVTGAQSLIENIESVQADLLLDGSEKGEINQSVMLKLKDSNNVEAGLIQIVPEQIIIRADITSEVEEKEVDIVPQFNNENDRNLWENNIEFEPQIVLIRGKEEDLANITSIETNNIEVTALVRDGEVQVGLSLPEGISLVEPDQLVTIKSLNVPAGATDNFQPETNDNQPTI
ncbi:MAG: CdaR family protein [Candidatus Gracilibacteria bacterium]